MMSKTTTGTAVNEPEPTGETYYVFIEDDTWTLHNVTQVSTHYSGNLFFYRGAALLAGFCAGSWLRFVRATND